MNDLISCKAATKEIRKCRFVVDAIERIKRLPSAEKVGKWIEWWPGDCALIMTGEEMLWMCSECTAKFSDKSRYCPNCGAKMDEVMKDE